MCESPVISVIVPVYQSEKYMRRCLDSIRAQSFSDFEAILVDDGSIDGSGIICDEYAIQDSRFRTIHKKHEGVSSARQTGLDAANGEYIIHADPDDWVEPTWLQDLFQRITEESADIVICDYERVYSNRTIYCCQKPSTLNNKDILVDLLEGRLWGCCWNKMVKKSCFDQCKVSFNTDLSFWEDLYVTCLLVLHGAKVSYLPEMLYHYDSIVNSNSLLRSSPSEEKIQSMIFFIDELSPLMNACVFDNGWYLFKSKIKNNLFIFKAQASRIRNTYPEINHRYIIESKSFSWRSLEYCVGLCLSGYSFLANSLWRFLVFARFVKCAVMSFVQKNSSFAVL